MAVDIKQQVFDLKKEFVKKFATEGKLKADSVFLIGSCAGKEDDFNDWYQDFDIHILYNKSEISEEELSEIYKKFEAIQSKFNKENISVEWNVKDRHWKQVPNNKFELNLSVHGTIINKFDFHRRIRHNPILGWNMYQICEPLHGKAPVEYVGLVEPTRLDLFHSVGGVSWMIENFYRTLWFFFTEPETQKFYPYIEGYCWNVPSSIMLQYYLLQNGKPGTRKVALKYLLSTDNFPEKLKEKLELIVKHKRSSSQDKNLHKELINASYSVASWLVREMQRLLKLDLPISEKDFDLRKGIYASVIEGKKINELHKFISFDESDFYESYKILVEETKKENVNSSYAEMPEFVMNIIRKDLPESTKIYFWNDLNILRYKLSHDFDLSKDSVTTNGVFWGWETGIQALLQRANELLILRARDESKIIDIIQTFYNISRFNLEKLGYNTVKNNMSNDPVELIASFARLVDENINL